MKQEIQAEERGGFLPLSSFVFFLLPPSPIPPPIPSTSRLALLICIMILRRRRRRGGGRGSFFPDSLMASPNVRATDGTYVRSIVHHHRKPRRDDLRSFSLRPLMPGNFSFAHKRRPRSKYLLLSSSPIRRLVWVSMPPGKVGREGFCRIFSTLSRDQCGKRPSPELKAGI